MMGRQGGNGANSLLLVRETEGTGRAGPTLLATKEKRLWEPLETAGKPGFRHLEKGGLGVVVWLVAVGQRGGTSDVRHVGQD